MEEAKDEVEQDITTQVEDIEALKVGDLLTESRYRELRDSHGIVFKAGMGAEAVLDILRDFDLDALRDNLQEEMQSTSGDSGGRRPSSGCASSRRSARAATGPSG